MQRDKYSSVLIVGRPFNFSELNIKPGTCGEYQMGHGNVKLIRLANHPIRARAFIFARHSQTSQELLSRSLSNCQSLCTLNVVQFLNLSGLVNCVTKSLNRSQRLCLSGLGGNSRSLPFLGMKVSDSRS